MPGDAFGSERRLSEAAPRWRSPEPCRHIAAPDRHKDTRTLLKHDGPIHNTMHSPPRGPRDPHGGVEPALAMDLLLTTGSVARDAGEGTGASA